MPVFCPSAPSFLFIISKLWSSFCELRLLYRGQDWLDCQSRCPAHHPAKRWTQDPGLLPEFESKEESCEDSGRENTTHPQGSGRDYALVSCPLDSRFPVLSEIWFVCLFLFFLWSGSVPTSPQWTSLLKWVSGSLFHAIKDPQHQSWQLKSDMAQFAMVASRTFDSGSLSSLWGGGVRTRSIKTTWRHCAPFSLAVSWSQRVRQIPSLLWISCLCPF